MRAPGRGEAGARTPGQRVARRRVARPASASSTSTPPEMVLDQYIGVAIANLAARMNDHIASGVAMVRIEPTGQFVRSAHDLRRRRRLSADGG